MATSSKGYLGILKWSLAQAGMNQGNGNSNDENNSNNNNNPTTSTGNEESVARPMTPERMQFLKEALAACTVDPIENMQKALNIIFDVVEVKKDEAKTSAEAGSDSSTASSSSTNSSSSSSAADTIDDDVIERKQGAFDALLEHVENVDDARDFMKIGGMDKIWKIIINDSGKWDVVLRMSALNVFGACIQNHPETQKKAMDIGALPVLRKMALQPEEDNEPLQIKALFALSCLIRENEEGTRLFLKDKGIQILLKSISPEEGSSVDLTKKPIYRRKAIFLVCYLFASVPIIMAPTIDISFPLFCKFITRGNDDVDLIYSALRALTTMLDDYYVRARFSKDHEIQLNQALTFIKNREEFESPIAELKEALARTPTLQNANVNSSSASSSSAENKVMLLGN